MKLSNINISFREKVIYKNFNIEFNDNRINCIIGKSGVGKTTLLNYIADYLVEEGMRVAYIFQNDTLIPWLNVYSNIKLIGKTYIKDKNLLDNKINEILNAVGLIDFKYYYPNQLSGGMKQRVNFARALICKIDVLIMDEPFKSLDIKCKNEMLNIIKDVNRKKNITIIIVTHDKEVMLSLADSIFLLGNNPVSVIEECNNSKFEYILKKYYKSC